MSGFSHKTHIDAILACDCRHHTDRKIERLKHWSLLDVDFTVTEEFVAMPAGGLQSLRIRVAAKGANGLSHRNTISISDAQYCWIERTSYRFTTKIRIMIT